MRGEPPRLAWPLADWSYSDAKHQHRQPPAPATTSTSTSTSTKARRRRRRRRAQPRATRRQEEGEKSRQDNKPSPKPKTHTKPPQADMPSFFSFFFHPPSFDVSTCQVGGGRAMARCDWPGLQICRAHQCAARSGMKKSVHDRLMLAAGPGCQSAKRRCVIGDTPPPYRPTLPPCPPYLCLGPRPPSAHLHCHPVSNQHHVRTHATTMSIQLESLVLGTTSFPALRL